MLRDRFKDAPWFSTARVHCLVGGAGGIGSWLALLISRAGFYPEVHDFDIIEAHNIGGQLYSKSDIGKYKVDALKETVKLFSDMDISVSTEKMDENSTTSNYVFSAFDNMKARKDMFEVWHRENKGDPNSIFIDGRLLMEQMQIYCVTPSTADRYREEALFDDNEVEVEACTLKQTSHSAAMIASLMVGFFTNHITNVRKGKIREVPFYHEYYIPINLTT